MKHAEGRVLKPRVLNGIPEVSCEEVYGQFKNLLGNVRIVDVRGPDEFKGELGHIQGAELKVLGPELMEFLDKGDRSEEIIFVCRSGGRSGQATMAALQLGYKFPINMAGGMIRWNNLQFPKG
jgi:rhodanese-related sulfurtransferase